MQNKLDPRSEAMTFIAYDTGEKAYKFMQKDNSIFTATHALFDKETFLRAKNNNGSSKDKLQIRPPGILDQEEINIPTHPDTDNDHSHDDPHTDDSSDSAPDDKHEKSSSEDEGKGSVDEEDEVEDELRAI